MTQLAPSFRHSHEHDVRGMKERQVEVTNPDGTTTLHTFWTDSQDAPARVAWPELEDDRGQGFGNFKLFPPFPPD
jgi:hypothetical protein